MLLQLRIGVSKFVMYRVEQKKALSSENWVRTFQNWLIWLCISRSPCLAALWVGIFKQGTFILHNPVVRLKMIVEKIVFCTNVRVKRPSKWARSEKKGERKRDEVELKFNRIWQRISAHFKNQSRTWRTDQKGFFLYHLLRKCFLWSCYCMILHQQCNEYATDMAFYSQRVYTENLKKTFSRLRDPASDRRGEFTQPRTSLFVGLFMYSLGSWKIQYNSYGHHCRGWIVDIHREIWWMPNLQGEGLEERPLWGAPGVGGVDLDGVLGARVEAADVERRLVRRDVQHHWVVPSVVHLKKQNLGYVIALLQCLSDIVTVTRPKNSHKPIIEFNCHRQIILLEY